MSEERIRNEDIEQDNKRFYEKELYFLYESLRKIVPDGDMDERIAKRTLNLMGFRPEDIQIHGDQISILNTVNFSRCMKHYRQTQGIPIGE